MHYFSFCVIIAPIYSPAGPFLCRLAALLQLAVRDEEAEQREFAAGRDSSGRPESRSASSARASSSANGTDDDWDSGKDEFRIAIQPGEGSDDEGSAGSPTLDEMSFPGYSRYGDAPISPAAPAVAEESALSRLMNRKGGINAAAAAALSRASPVAFAYPDVPLIRLILKTMANLLGAANSSSVYSDEFRGELANWLLEVDVGPAGNAEGRVKLRRIAKKDQIVMFYFNSITQC